MVLESPHIKMIKQSLVLTAIAASFVFGGHLANMQNENAVLNAKLATQAEWQKKLDTERGRLNEVSQKLEEKMETLRPVYTTINRKVEREVQKEFYSDPNCTLPQTGVDLINQNVNDLNKARKAKP